MTNARYCNSGQQTPRGPRPPRLPHPLNCRQGQGQKKEPTQSGSAHAGGPAERAGTGSHSGLVPCLVLPLTSCIALASLAIPAFLSGKWGQLPAWRLVRGLHELTYLKPPITGLKSDSFGATGSCHCSTVITKARRTWRGRHPDSGSCSHLPHLLTCDPG